MMEKQIEKSYYNCLDGLRMIAAFGIVMMHVEANSVYNIDGWLYKTCITLFAKFVFLFMVVSSFGMCCGYYDKIINISMLKDLEKYYHSLQY